MAKLGAKTGSKNGAKSKSGGGLVDNIKTLVYAGLIALGIRTIAFEPFNIPSGSMIPTLLVGDYLFVSKYAYGYSHYSLPLAPNLFSGRILGRLPARGDVAVFINTQDHSEDYIKRIIGLPGDRIQVTNGELCINGTLVPRVRVGDYSLSADMRRVVAAEYRETLPGGVQHDIIKFASDTFANNTPEYKVPENHFFAMGDNRDDSADSRFGLGFVPLENLVGRAEFIFFSTDGRAPLWEVWEWPFEIRWNRLLHGIN